jgi:hypothetical protein
MNLNFFYKSFLLIMIVSLVNCKKKEVKPSINQLLTNRGSKTWILNSTVVDGKETLFECEKDNEWTFNNNNIINKSSGFLRCDIYENDESDKYFLGGPTNEIIYFTVRDSTYDAYWDDYTSFNRIIKADIIEIDENVLKYQETDYSDWGDQVQKTVTTLTKK